ncbi:MAG: flagellar biosynthesis protein FlhB [Thermotogaceae bacterium]|nr:flagellar biosynthesis protein FlhB [Thermotogaceae bacterium]
MGRCNISNCFTSEQHTVAFCRRSFAIDIQLFADPDRTERATPRRRRKAREEGQVAVSRELNMAVSFLAAALGMRYLALRLLSSLTSGMITFISLDGADEVRNLAAKVTTVYEDLFIVSGIFLLLIMIAVVVTGALQTRFLISLKPLKFDLKRISPIEGFKRMFSLRSLFELLKAIFKTVVVGYIAYSVIVANWNLLFLYPQMAIWDGVVSVMNIASEVMLKCGIALLILALIDFFYQRWEYERNIRMTKQEVKEEYKEVEGNPEVRRRQREVMSRLASGRMLQEVPKADVVVTNPTHIAVALKYEPEEMNAPEVVAKGVDEIAEKIKEIAKENDIPILRNPPLAQRLYRTTDVGEEIPSDLYRAVAEVLAQVYAMRERQHV